LSDAQVAVPQAKNPVRTGFSSPAINGQLTRFLFPGRRQFCQAKAKQGKRSRLWNCSCSCSCSLLKIRKSHVVSASTVAKIASVIGAANAVGSIPVDVPGRLYYAIRNPDFTEVYPVTGLNEFRFAVEVIPSAVDHDVIDKDLSEQNVEGRDGGLLCLSSEKRVRRTMMVCRVRACPGRPIEIEQCTITAFTHRCARIAEGDVVQLASNSNAAGAYQFTITDIVGDAVGAYRGTEMHMMKELGAVRLIAKRYEELGYVVTLWPPPSSIPFSVGNHIVDILATKGDEISSLTSRRLAPGPTRSPISASTRRCSGTAVGGSCSRQ
jgi:hypothetical protein